MVTVKTPTDEQIRTFWEWCGKLTKESCPICHGTKCLDTNQGEHRPAHIVPCNNCRRTGFFWKYPELDLNNLFKYAVPKLGKEPNVFLRLCTGEGWTTKGWLCTASSFVGGGKSRTVEGVESPTLALFWALWEIVKEK